MGVNRTVCVNVEGEKVRSFTGEDSPPMDFDSDEETLLRSSSPPLRQGL